jgi:single-stranded-DNA-specific exonuclease
MGGGGHPMAAGFSIETGKIEVFRKEFEKVTKPLLTEDVLTKRIKIDVEVGFDSLNQKLMKELVKFEPFGIGNPTPVFISKNVNVANARTVGSNAKHLKLILNNKGFAFNAIAFGKGEVYKKLLSVNSVDVVYNLVRDTWNGKDELQLKVKDLRFN